MGHQRDASTQKATQLSSPSFVGLTINLCIDRLTSVCLAILADKPDKSCPDLDLDQAMMSKGVLTRP